MIRRSLEHGQVMTELLRLNFALLHLHHQTLVELLVILGQPIHLDAQGRDRLTLTDDLLLETEGVGALNVQLGLQPGICGQCSSKLCGEVVVRDSRATVASKSRRFRNWHGNLTDKALGSIF